MIKRYRKGTITHLTPDFCVYEFDCPCLRVSCIETLISESMIQKLQKMREKTGFPITITSGTRCHDHQDDLRKSGAETSVGISSHERGVACDMVCGAYDGEQLAAIAREAGFQNIGIGKRFIHADEREDGPREWRYST
jgi:uncharacterized protein YcbK (DUF882 family)